MATKSSRAFASFGAGLFIISAIAFPVAVIYSIYQENKTQNNNQSNTQLTDAQKKALEEASKKSKENNVTKLQGAPLANFTPTTSIPQLQTQDTVPGTGDTVKPGAKVTVDYTGAVASTGIVFQSSKDSGQPVSFGLDQVIKGWTEGIPGMKVGGTRRLLIPASLAYGANPPQGSGIPANADLVFDVTLHSVSK